MMLLERLNSFDQGQETSQIFSGLVSQRKRARGGGVFACPLVEGGNETATS